MTLRYRSCLLTISRCKLRRPTLKRCHGCCSSICTRSALPSTVLHAVRLLSLSTLDPICHRHPVCPRSPSSRRMTNRGLLFLRRSRHHPLVYATRPTLSTIVATGRANTAAQSHHAPHYGCSETILAVHRASARRTAGMGPPSRSPRSVLVWEWVH